MGKNLGEVHMGQLAQCMPTLLPNLLAPQTHASLKEDRTLQHHQFRKGINSTAIAIASITSSVYQSTTTDTMVSSGSRTCCNVIIAILTLWSVISLIVIVVWVTNPQLRDIKLCRDNLAEEEEKVKQGQANQRALEKLVEAGRKIQAAQEAEINLLKVVQQNYSASLNDCRHENDILLTVNITVLEKEIEMHKEIEANLTAEIAAHQDQIENLKANLTQSLHQREACRAQTVVAENRQLMAESENKVCESARAETQRQLEKCKKVNPPG